MLLNLRQEFLARWPSRYCCVKLTLQWKYSSNVNCVALAGEIATKPRTRSVQVATLGRMTNGRA